MFENWIAIIISGISLLISLITSWNSWWKSRASIKIEQTHDAARSLYFQSFDASVNNDDSDANPVFRSVLLIEIIITNKSSLPISVLEFSIDGFPTFDSYSYTKDSFQATLKEGSSIQLGNDSAIKYLKPELTIEPYTSERGYIFFWHGAERDLDIDNELDLTVRTSRKEFEVKVKVSGKYESSKKNAHVTTDEEGNKIIKYY